MGGHVHEGPPYKVPAYEDFTVKGIPQLEELEEALKKKGLRDPWIRNEAWRYHPGFGSRWARANKVFFRGFPLGLGLALLTVGLTKLYGGGAGHHGGDGHQDTDEKSGH